MQNSCPPSHFRCSDGPCIFRRYQCDGYRDCRDGSDEAVKLCGNNPCQGKIRCQKPGRCIPLSWCCHRPSNTSSADCGGWERRKCCWLKNSFIPPTSKSTQHSESAFMDGLEMDPQTTSISPSVANKHYPLYVAISVLALCALMVAIGLVVYGIHVYFCKRRFRRQQETIGQYSSRPRQTIACCRPCSISTHSNGRHVCGGPNSNTVLIGTSQFNGALPRRLLIEAIMPRSLEFAPFIQSNQGDVETAGNRGDELPPPPYSECGGSGRGVGLERIAEEAEDGLPSYEAAIKLHQSN